MPDYTGRFTGRAEAYSISRPSYPKKVLEVLRSELELRPTWTIGDIGSGTGLLTRLFLENGNRVFAVEPNNEMRGVAEDTFHDWPNFVSVKGKAEATELADFSVDLVVCGQAFHWFDHDLAKKEFRRILRDDNKSVCIVYNNRSKDDPFMKEYDRIVRKYGTNRAGTPEITDTLLGSWYRPLTFKQFALLNEQFLDLELLLGRMLSASYMPGEADAEKFSALRKEVTRLFSEYENRGRVRMLYQTEISLGLL